MTPRESQITRMRQQVLGRIERKLPKASYRELLVLDGVLASLIHLNKTRLKMDALAKWIFHVTPEQHRNMLRAYKLPKGRPAKAKR